MIVKRDWFKVIGTLGLFVLLVSGAWAQEGPKKKGHKKEGNHGHKEVHWTYEGETGPEHWGKFFPQCSTGKSQSPLDIHGPFTRGSAPLQISYKTSPLKILNNGHTIVVHYAPGSSMTINNKTYELLQFHFHRPSEEKIDGQPKAMVAHFVHKSFGGKLAVIGVLLDEGKENDLIKTLWANLPEKEGAESVVENVTIDANDLLPKKLDYYHYMGSLTTPPCTEGVAFYILKQTKSISLSQVEAFPFELNARPVQPPNGREIVESAMQGG